MKKLLRKVSAVLLTAAMVSGMCFASFARSTPAEGGTQVKVGENSKADITVGVAPLDGEESANGGDTLQAYKVVAITYTSDGNKLSYAFTEEFNNFLSSKLGTAWAGLTPESYADLTEDQLKPLLGNFTAYVKDEANKVTPAYTQKDEDNNGIVTFPGVDMGQYIIVGDGSSNGAKIYQTVTAEVNPTVIDGKPWIYPAYTVAMKTSKPTIGKEIAGGTVEDTTIPVLNPVPENDKHAGTHQQTTEIGKTITYHLNVSVPTYPEGATNQTFYVGDILSKGLDFLPQADGSNVVVKGYAKNEAPENGKTLTEKTDYVTEVIKKANDETVDEAERGTTALYIDFTDFSKIAAFDHIVIEYTAKLNADANIGTIDGNPNNAELIYSNSPFDGSTWEPGEERPENKPGYGKDEDMEVVYTYALVIDKYEEKHEGEKLSGAQFQIFTDEACANPFLDGDGKEVILTTDANGAALYAGLEKGTYYLKELVAPAGYNLLDAPVKIEIDGSKIPYYTKQETSVTHYTYSSTDDLNTGEQATINGDYAWINSNGEVITTAEATAPEGYAAAYVVKEDTKTENVIVIDKTAADSENAANGFYKAGVSNNKGAHLPSTGGMGTTVFTVVGLILMIGAGVVLITRRRMFGRQ